MDLLADAPTPAAENTHVVIPAHERIIAFEILMPIERGEIEILRLGFNRHISQVTTTPIAAHATPRALA